MLELSVKASLSTTERAAMIAARRNYQLETVIDNSLFRKKFGKKIEVIKLSDGSTMTAQNVCWVGNTMRYTYSYASLLAGKNISYGTDFHTFSNYVPSVYEVDLDRALLKYFTLMYVGENAGTQSLYQTQLATLTSQ